MCFKDAWLIQNKIAQAQEQDALSDADFESDDGGMSDLNDQGSGSEEEEKDLPAKKKRKA